MGLLMKYLFIGLGSIGMRHLKNLRLLTGEPIYALRTKIDPDIDRRYKITSTTSLKEAVALKPDVVFVTNPTSKHMEYARLFSNCHLFIEKPISTNSTHVARLLAIMESNNKICFVGFNYRFYLDLSNIYSMMSWEGHEPHNFGLGKSLFAQVNFGKWLPDWHPGEDYKESCNARKELGGGAVLSLSHPIDYVCWLFGSVRSVYAHTDKVSSLDIDVEDIASIVLEMRNKTIVEIHLDYLHPEFVHNINIVYEKKVMSRDLNDAKKRDESFVKELQHFLKCVKGEEQPIISNKDIICVMRIIDAIKESSRTGRKVYL